MRGGATCYRIRHRGGRSPRIFPRLNSPRCALHRGNASDSLGAATATTAAVAAAARIH